VSPEARLAPILLRQDGLVTAAQAGDAGISARTVQRRVGSGAWERVMPRVFLVAGHPTTDAVRVRAAGLWAGERGVISGPAAAWWHRMHPTAPSVVDLTVPRAPGSPARSRACGCGGGTCRISTSCASTDCGSPTRR
jgi:putative AbiEi antitoxin of type IV toxin-antitoxin system